MFAKFHRLPKSTWVAMLCAACLVFSSVYSKAQDAAPSATQNGEVKLQLSKQTLQNGLRVVLAPDRTSPTVAIAVVYDVGSRNEERGKTGLAHLFEHLMFQGSKQVKKGEHSALITSRGGTANAITTADRTTYFQVLPSNELALGLWLEADRMTSLDLTQENLDNQRKVIAEEYRSKVSNVPYAHGALRLTEILYQGYAPYDHSEYGSLVDLDQADLAIVKDFQAKYYGPNNAVLCIAGDFAEAEASALVKKYFEGISKISTPSFTDPTPLVQTSPRSSTVKDEHADSPALLFGYKTPKFGDSSLPALDLTAMILGAGESSRLYHLLVRDKGVAQDVSARLSPRRGPGFFEVDIKLTSKADAAVVTSLVDTALKDLAAKGPTADELTKVKRRATTQRLLSLQTNLARARALADRELFLGDPTVLLSESALIAAVTADDIKSVVLTYLTSTKRTSVEIYPPAPPEPPKPAAAKSPPKSTQSTPVQNTAPVDKKKAPSPPPLPKSAKKPTKKLGSP
ncbi:MAG: insulinase family protein [Polyangiaceae bacterium]|nr:insulinase family protein [Polyangiaceae bacterium]